MVEFRWIIMSLFVMLAFGFTEIEQYSSAGDEVTLSCGDVTDDQDKCGGTTWLFSDSGNTVELVTLGQIGEKVKSESDRLSVTERCSLVIKKVTVQDVGRYTCRLFKSGHQQGPDSLVQLSVITMTEHEDGDEVTLSCSVSTREQCRHTVKWLYERTDVETPHAYCSVTVTFPTHLKPKYREAFKCELTDGYTAKVHLFTFIPQSSGEKPGGRATTASTTSPATTSTSPATTSTSPATTSTSPAGNKWTSVTTSTPEVTHNTATTNDSNQTNQVWWSFIIIVPVALAAISVAVIRWKRSEGSETQMDDNTADPEGGVSYASITYTKKADRKARVRGDDDDGGDAVTYSTVRAPSSPAGASADPSNLYAALNKPKK